MARPFDLDAEMHSAILSVTGRHLSAFERLGCKGSAIAAIGATQAPFGVMRCDMRAGQFFEPTSEPYGVDAVLMPVMCEGAVIDLIAWRTLAPDGWLWRNGGGWALGIDLITSPPHWDGFRDITLHATPLEWLRAGGIGAVILDWSAVSYIRKLSFFDTVHCNDLRVQKRLGFILSAPARKPRIVSGARHGQAA